MSALELNESLFAKIAGWDVVKEARNAVASGKVLSADWQPPLLRGVYQQGGSAIRAGLVLKDTINIENLCPCRQSRESGMICAHSVAVGLHWLKQNAPVPPPAGAAKNSAASSAAKQASATTSAKRLRRAASGENGEALELFVLFPPNFAPAAAKGKVTLYFEAKTAQGRAPLSTLPLDKPFAVTAEDAPMLEAIETLAESGPPAMLMLTASQLTELLPKLTGHPRVTLGKSQPLTVSTEPWPLPLAATLLENGEIILKCSVATPPSLIRGVAVTWVFVADGAQSSSSARSSPDETRGAGAPRFDAPVLHPIGIPASIAEIFEGPVKIPRSRVPQFLSVDWPRLVANCDVAADFDPEDFELTPATPRFKLHLAGGLAMLSAKLECFYGERRITPGVSTPEDAVWLPDPVVTTRYSTRNLPAEQEAVARFTRHGFSGPDQHGCWNVKDQNSVLTFFAREFPRMEKEWSVTLEERLERSTEQNLERVDLHFAVTPSGEQWFDLRVDYQTSGGERLSAADVQSLLLSGRGKSKSGKFLLIDSEAVEEFQEVLLDAQPRQNLQGYRLANAQAGFVDATLRKQGWTPQAPAAWTQRTAQQRGEAKPELPALGELEKILRPYQKEGVAWLAFLRANGFGGILADEMGLGKTVQVLALIAAGSSRRKEALTSSAGNSQSLLTSAATLVICPTSLVHNWAAEAAKFTPQLRVLALHGPRRAELFAQIPTSDLVVTSYALARRDFEQYRDVEFDTVVLDEAQHIKNRATQNAQAVKAIRSRHRLVLTGTPMENSVLDLWSMFDFLMPGYLGAAKDFRERYEVPIAKLRDAATQDRLARRVRPFLLRRLKRDVAPELPEKIEQVSYCELSEEQRAIYTQLLEAGRREVLDAVGANGLAKSRMLVLTALLRLRQVCCDLRLLGVQERGRPARALESDAAAERTEPAGGPPALQASGKLDLFAELLDEILDGGHRVLVFSQFTTMLGLLRERLEADGVQFCYLDGSTTNRAEVVEKFQRDARIPVFLISLKAGGTGLNLTGADTVIHFDPWWNPAVEAQATDRAHRIGQRKVVTSYKLITRGTVEEKILNLQERKRALIQGTLGGEETLAEALSWDEIQDLLAG
ncbi:MAG: SNF2 helicase associated domain-containing protein [Verrucomicrobia bacterium]|nr:SNF2 helicase associated domain-containing protein [Verrucomicrobiota bacterium]